MPQRARQKHSSAEEPITARIRRRAESANVASNGQDGSNCAETTPHQNNPNSPDAPALSFQARIALERQRKGQHPVLN